MKLPAPVSFAAGLVPALAAGWLLFPRLLYRTEAQPLPFNHKAHAEQGMACADCHAVTGDGRFAGLPKTESCAGCHAEKGENAAVNALVANPKHTYRAGSTAVVHLPLGSKTGLMVPQAALVRDGDLVGVIVRKNGTDDRRWVRIGVSTPTHVEVLSGHSAGDVIVVPTGGNATAPKQPGA